MTVVDAHLHPFLPVSEAYPRTVEPLFPADRSAPIELLGADMTAAGVDRAVLVALSPHDRYVAECVAGDPRRFAGVLVHDPDEDGGAAIERIGSAGARGLRFMGLDARGITDPDALAAMPVLAALAEHDLVCWLYPRPDDLPILPGLLARLPGLTVMLNHLGFGLATADAGDRRSPDDATPSTLETVCALAVHPRVHVLVSGQYAFSTSPWPHLDVAPVARRLHDAFGAHRLLWASDWPWIREEPGYLAQLDLVDIHLPDLTESERAAVLGGTATALLFDHPERR